MTKLYSGKNGKSTPKFDQLLPKFASINAKNVIFKDRNGCTKPKNDINKGQKYHMNRQISIPAGAEQWLINLIELYNRSDMTFHQIAESENLSEKSVSNVFLGKSKNPGVDLIRRIIHALGGHWSEIFGESGAVIGGQDLATLQAEVDRLKAENDKLKTEKDALTADNIILREKVEVLRDKNDALKDDIIMLHNHYNKIKPNN